MSDDNPYESSPTLPAISGSGNAVRSVFWWLVFLQPVLTVAAIHFCWWITVVSLGRRPEYGEHPETEPLHSLFHWVAFATVISLLSTWGMVPVGITWSFAEPFSQVGATTWRRKLACVIAYLIMLSLSGVVLSTDPLNVFSWFID